MCRSKYEKKKNPTGSIKTNKQKTSKEINTFLSIQAAETGRVTSVHKNQKFYQKEGNTVIKKGLKTTKRTLKNKKLWCDKEKLSPMSLKTFANGTFG